MKDFFSQTRRNITQDIPFGKDLKFIVVGRAYLNHEEFEYILKDAEKNKIAIVFLEENIETSISDKIDEYERKYGVKIFKAPENYKELGGYEKVKINDKNFLFLSIPPKNNSIIPHSDASISDNQLKFLKENLESQRKKAVAIIIDNLPSDWIERVFPLLVSHGNVNVFVGNFSSLTLSNGNGVNYYSTGPMQLGKENVTNNDSQKYWSCIVPNNKDFVKCDTKDLKIPERDKNNNIAQDFFNSLRNLKQKILESFKLNLTESLKVNMKDIRYLIVKKEGLRCSFPESGIIIEGAGNYNPGKIFGGMDIDDNERIYFVSNKKSPEDYINKVYFFIPEFKAQYCHNFEVSFSDYDFNLDLEKFRSKLDKFSLSIGEKESKELLDNIPTDQERAESDFKFKYVDAELENNGEKYKTEIKYRGLTAFHWANEKKSYALKFKDYYKNNEKLLFYIPEKRAYIGEYLTNKIAEFFGLQALKSKFGELKINGKNQGIYYVSEDFDKYFLAKRKMADANIYSTDPVKVSGMDFSVNSFTRDIFLSTINSFENYFDKDVEYFLKVAKSEREDLAKNWKKHFDPGNIGKILALYAITGTAHYDMHNIIWYKDPASGRIYFFPWDFMNYTIAGDLQEESLKGINNSFINRNPLFSKLLEIPEIRNESNKIIYNQADALVKYLDNFKNREYINLLANFLADETTEFYLGDGNRPTFADFMKIPTVFEKNILYLKNKLSATDVVASRSNFAERSMTIGIISNSFSSVKINKLILNYKGINIEKVAFNGRVLEKENDYKIEENSDGTINAIFIRDLMMSPLLSYDEKYASIIKLNPANAVLDLNFSDETKNIEMTLEIENMSTNKKKVISIPKQKANISQPSEINVESKDFEHKLLVKTEKNTYTFISKDVEIMEDIIIPENVALQIKEGTTLRFSKGKSLISYGKIIAKGTKENPIKFTSSDLNESWGVLGIIQENSSGEFENCIFEKGGDADINGIYLSAMLSVYFSNASVKDCVFQYASRSSGDDALNFKNGLFKVENSKFISNKFDGIDYDFPKSGSIIRNNIFLDNGNDGMDISGSDDLLIEGNRIENSGDKGISIGEEASADIRNNLIKNNNFGVAVKDSSSIRIIGNNLVANKVGVAAYNKKEVFNGALALVQDSKFEENKQDFGRELIGENDKRFKDRKYESRIMVFNSKYKLNDSTVEETIKEPAEPMTSKRKFIKAFLNDNLEKYGYKFATLINVAEEFSIEDSHAKNFPPGSNKKFE
jgi:spore coat protein H